MIFGFQCCAASEENKSHIVSKPAAKKKGKDSRRRSKPSVRFSDFSDQNTADSTFQGNLLSPTGSTPRLDASFSSSSSHPTRASIAADNALVGEPQYPESGSSIPRSAFATAPARPPAEQQRSRFHALPQTMPSTSLAHGGDVYLNSSTVSMPGPNWESKLLLSATRR